MTFLKCSNILLFLIFTIVIVNPSVAQDSPLIPNSSHVSMRLQNISQLESPVGAITHRFPSNISIEDIRAARLNNLSRNMNISGRLKKPVNVTSAGIYSRKTDAVNATNKNLMVSKTQL